MSLTVKASGIYHITHIIRNEWLYHARALEFELRTAAHTLEHSRALEAREFFEKDPRAHQLQRIACAMRAMRLAARDIAIPTSTAWETIKAIATPELRSSEHFRIAEDAVRALRVLDPSEPD